MDLITCYVLAGGWSDGTKIVNDGDLIDLPQADLDQLSRWGIVRAATQSEIDANKPTPTVVAEAKKTAATTAPKTEVTETAPVK
jgi:hypothetical protein